MFFVFLALALDWLIYKKISKVNTFWNYLFCIGAYPYLLVILYCLVVGIYNWDLVETFFGIWLAVVIYWYVSIPSLILMIISYANIKRVHKTSIDN